MYGDKKEIREELSQIMDVRIMATKIYENHFSKQKGQNAYKNIVTL